MKKIYSLLLVLLMAVMGVNTAKAWTVVVDASLKGWFIAQYDAGSVWEGKYVLVLWQSSACKDYASSSETPWYSYREWINHIVFADVFSGTPNIGTYCFADMPNLEVAFCYTGHQHDYYEVRAHAFENCPKLKEVDLRKATSIGDYAFKGCSSLGDQIFGLGESVSYIGAHAFEDCTKLCGVYSDLKFSYTVGERAFCNCTNFRYIDGENLKSVGDYAFANCKLTTIDMRKCTSIGDRAFINNELTYVRLGSAINEIKTKAFSSALEDNGTFVITRSTPPTTASDAFAGCNQSTITLSLGAGASGYNVAPWKYFKEYEADAEMYVAISGTTLTVYFDGKRSQRGGHWETNYNYGWDLTDAEKKSVTKVVFDASMNNCLPTKTTNWFSGFENLVTVENIQNLHTDEVTEMGYMFNNCPKLQAIDLSHFNTSKVEKTYSMFGGCASLTELNVNHFDISSVTNALSMFGGCTNLQRIYCEKDWTGIGGGWYLFNNCTSLVGGWGTPYDASKVDAQYYARPDGGEDAPGYFWRLTDTGEKPVKPEGIDNVQSDKVQSTKVIRDGMLLIERNGKTYNAQGAEVR